MIQTLISSKTRIKLLLKFFLNSDTTAYLRGLASELGDSSNSIRLELNRLEEAGMLESFTSGNKKIYRANKSHPLFDEVHRILRKHVGVDKIIENVVNRLGNVTSVYLSGAFAQGLDSDILDLIFFGEINQQFLVELIAKVEKLIDRRIRYICYSEQEEETIDWGKFEVKPLLIWRSEEDEGA